MTFYMEENKYNEKRMRKKLQENFSRRHVKRGEYLDKSTK